MTEDAWYKASSVHQHVSRGYLHRFTHTFLHGMYIQMEIAICNRNVPSFFRMRTMQKEHLICQQWIPVDVHRYDLEKWNLFKVELILSSIQFVFSSGCHTPGNVAGVTCW